MKGVKLSKDDQDVISRKIAERVGQMKPYVSSDCVEVIFQNIADESKIIEELYVVEVVVKVGQMTFYFLRPKERYI